MASILIGRSEAHRTKTDKDNADTVRVIGAGLPRTGTSSLKEALEILGFGPCHHMSEVFNKPEQAVMFNRILDGYPADFTQVLKGYGSTTDNPTSYCYKDIHRAFPMAKIILTVRDSDEKWFESLKNTIAAIHDDFWLRMAVLPFRNLRLASALGNKLFEKQFGQIEKLGPKIHSLHNAKVISENKPEDLLVFNVKEGWGPLCRFLNVPIPDNVPFPKLNDTDYFRNVFGKAKRVGLLIYATVGVLLGAFIFNFDHVKTMFLTVSKR